MHSKPLSAFILALLLSPTTLFASEYLDAEQIQANLTGKTLTWQHMFKSKSGKSYMAADGAIVGTANGSHREGTWHLDGNKLCVSWGSCLKIEADGEGGYYKIKGSKRVVHITTVENGNTL